MEPHVAAVVILIPLRVFGALVSGVADCDEVYNYWEAAHLLVSDAPHRRPFQTWEYAPNYALRSWAFVAPFALLAKVVDAVAGGAGATPLTFAAVRALGLAVPCACAEAALVRGVSRKFGAGAAWTLGGFLIASAGLFSASSALLPSTAAMALAAASQALWAQDRRRQAVAAAVAATLWPGWPFVAVVFLPLFVDVLCREVGERGAARGLREVLSSGLVAGAAVGVPVAAFDALVYGRLTSPLYNVFAYNAGAGGDELYGVEPWTYYAKNLALNAAVPAALAALLPAALVLRKVVGAADPRRPAVAALAHAAPAAIWLAVLFARPHKEERFLFVAYPSLYVGGALALDALGDALARLAANVFKPTTTRNLVRFAAVGAALALGAARAAAVVGFYGSPQLAVWRAAGDAAASLAPANATVCVGGEWYRYPSSFFLPENARLAFLKSPFDGQLPRAYAAQPAPGLEGARALARADAVDKFNDRNVEDARAYAAAAACDVAVDLRFHGQDGGLAAALNADGRAWREVATSPFLDAARTPALARAFAIPGYSADRAAYAAYVVLQRA